MYSSVHDLVGLSLQGVKLRFFNPDVDVLLLELPAAIPAAFQSYQLGWDARPMAPPRAAVGIHYPHGAPRAISYTECALSGSIRVPQGFDYQPGRGIALFRAPPHMRSAPCKESRA